MGCGASKKAPGKQGTISPEVKPASTPSKAPPVSKAASVSSPSALNKGSTSFVNLDDDSKVVLRKFMKLIVGNSERLVGMVAEFDADKGYLTEKEVFDFIDFYVVHAHEEGKKGAAAAIVLAADQAGKKVDHDSIYTLVQGILMGHESAAKELRVQRDYEKSVNHQAKQVQEQAAKADLSKVPLGPGVASCLRKLNKLMVANSERLVGMIGQFDEGDKEYLTQPELVAFIDFFLEESKKEVTEEASKAVFEACKGDGVTVNCDTVYTYTSALLRGREKESTRTSVTSGGKAPPAAPHDSTLDSIPEKPSAGAGVDHKEEVVKVVAPPSSLSDLKIPSPVLSMLRKLSKILLGNSERLVGMVGQFDEDDKGYLTEDQLYEFISFFIDGAEDDFDAAKGAAKALHSACRSAGAHLNSDTIFTFTKAMITGREAVDEKIEEPSRALSAVEAPPRLNTIEEGNDMDRSGSVFE